MMKKLSKRIFLGLLTITLGLLLIIPIKAFAVDEAPPQTADSNNMNNPTPVVQCQGDTIDKYYTFSVDTISNVEGDVTGFKITAYKNNNVSDSDLNFKLYKIGNKELGVDSVTFTPGTESKPKVVKLENYPDIKSLFTEVGANDASEDGNRFYTHLHFESVKGANANESNCNIGVKFKVKTSVGELGAIMDDISYASDKPIAKVTKGHEISKSVEPNNDFDKLIFHAYKNAIAEQTLTEGTTYYKQKCPVYATGRCQAF